MSPAIMTVDAVIDEQPLEPRERFVPVRHVVGLRVERMPRMAMMNLPRARFERRLEPLPLRLVDPLDDAGVDGDEGEAIGLDFEERAALKAGRHAVLSCADARPRR